ncbi:hypothetical protein GY26_01800 [Gammaproteobacteria bacterium MFB021]|nr:hypothetical protein GY26_01800 [Gammaproteobacteria bacterium MFB021]
MLIPPKIPSAPESQSGSTVRSSLTGSQNRANPYGVIPRVYGNPRWFPPLAGNSVTESAGDDQYLRMLLCLGYGPLEIAGHRVGPGLPVLANADVGGAIRIGETSLGEYEGVEWEIGTRDQLTLYTQDIVEEVPGIALDLQDKTTGGGHLDSQDQVGGVRTTAVDTTEISVDIVWPAGLYALDSKGKLSTVNVEILIEHRLVGDTAWTPKRSVIVSSRSKTTLRRNWRWGVPKGQYDVRVTRVRTSGGNREAVVADAQWSALRSIQGDNPAYGNDRHLLMALRIRATDQLNGVVDQLSIRTQAVLRVWNGSSFSLQATSSPAWAYLDALTGEQVARPITDAQINLPEIQSWATFCASAGLGYSWVHDSNETLFQRCRTIAATGQGSFSLQDGLYGIVRDDPNEPVTQMITPRNASRLRASRQFRKLPHALRVKYVDYDTGAANGTDAELIVYRDGYNAQNATIFEDFETQGVGSATEAAFHGNYHFRQAILRPETFTADMDWENLAAVRGNRCSLASDVLKVGLASARIESVDDVNNRITLDSRVEYTTERSYGIRARQQDGEQVLIPVTADEIGMVRTLSIGAEAYDLHPGDLVTYGELGRETIDTKITRIDPGPDFTATLTLVPAAVDIYDFANDPIYDPGITNPIDPRQVAPPAPVITSARGDSTAATRNADGSYRTLIRVSYIFPVRVGSPTVQVEARYRQLAITQWDYAGPFPATGTLAIADIEDHTEYVVQLRARNRDRVSPWSAEVSLDVTGQAAVTPSAVDVEVGTFSVTLRPQSIYVGSQYRFYRSAIELQPSEVAAGAVDLGVSTVMVDADLQPGTDYWYYVQAYTVYSVSEFYALKVTTRQDFDAILDAVDDNLRKPGGIVDQLENDIDGLAGTIDGITESITQAQQNATSALEKAQQAVDNGDFLAIEEDIRHAVLQAQTALGNAVLDVEHVVRVGEEQALAQQITTLSTSFGSSIAGLTQQLSALSTTTEATADLLTQLRSEYDDSSADFEQRITTLTTSTQALTQSVSNLQSSLNGVNASISTLEQTIALDELAQAIQQATLQTQNALGNAVVDVENLVRVDAETALAQQITTVSVEKDQQVAQVRQELAAVYDPSTGAVAQAVTTVDVNGVKGVVGIQVAGGTAQIVGIADQFAILNPISGELVTAFVVTDGRVIIPEALIGTVKFSKLVSDSGEVLIQNGKIKAKFLTVENARSPNYQSGTAGWSINADGSAELNNAVIRGRLEGATGTFAGKLSAQSVNAVDSVNIRDGAVSVSSSNVNQDEKSMPHGNNGTNAWSSVISASIDPVGKGVSVKTAFMYRLVASDDSYARASMLLRITVNGQEVYRWARVYGRLYDYRAYGDGNGATVDVTDYAHLPMVISGWNGSRTVAIEAAGDFNAGDFNTSRDFTVSERFIELTTLKK